MLLVTLALIILKFQNMMIRIHLIIISMALKLGDVVWAKVSGYPYWPGVISSVDGRNVTVHFIGDNTQ